MAYGGRWNFVGRLNRATGFVPELYFGVLKEIHLCWDHLLTPAEKQGRVLMINRMPRLGISSMFSLFHSVLVFNPPCPT